MKIYVVTCTFNVSRMLVDCAFNALKDAKAYAAGLNKDGVNAAARCKDLIALREGREAVPFFVEESGVRFEVVDVEVK